MRFFFFSLADRNNLLTEQVWQSTMREKKGTKKKRFIPTEETQKLWVTEVLIKKGRVLQLKEKRKKSPAPLQVQLGEADGWARMGGSC